MRYLDVTVSSSAIINILLLPAFGICNPYIAIFFGTVDTLLLLSVFIQYFVMNYSYIVIVFGTIDTLLLQANLIWNSYIAVLFGAVDILLLPANLICNS